MSEQRAVPSAALRGELLRVVRTWESDGMVRVLVLYGELAIDTLPIAQAEVTAAEDDAWPVLVLDLSQLNYVDSSGVQLVLLAQHTANEADRRLVLRLGHGFTRRVFDMLGITERLDVLDADGPPPRD
jgi:anti-anti-sigma factor